MMAYSSVFIKGVLLGNADLTGFANLSGLAFCQPRDLHLEDAAQNGHAARVSGVDAEIAQALAEQALAPAVRRV